MEQNKKKLLLGQIDKTDEVISTLSKNFSQGDVTDEINFLSVVRDKSKDFAVRILIQSVKTLKQKQLDE